MSLRPFSILLQLSERFQIVKRCPSRRRVQGWSPSQRTPSPLRTHLQGLLLPVSFILSYHVRKRLLLCWIPSSFYVFVVMVQVGC